MKHLLDVNVLVALAYGAHPNHSHAEAWMVSLPSTVQKLTCSITEIGFVRVSLQAKLCDTVAEAQSLLAAMLRAGHFTRLADTLGADTLPAYVKTAKATTDGHLLALATHHGAKLVTFDDGIPGAVLIR